MYSYEPSHSRRTRDVPPSSSNRYRDTGLYPDYGQPARSRSTRHQDPEPSGRSARDRHRRKSVSGHVSAEEGGRPSRRANVIASDDGRTSRDIYGTVYPERTSRHDAEAKTSDRHRQFRERRGGYETEEADKLRRAKSHSPRRAARDAEAPRKASPHAPSKSAWPEREHASDPYLSSKKKSRGQQYYGDDAYADHGSSGKDYVYGTSPSAMPRPPAGDYATYKTSPLSSGHGDPDEKLSKHSREPKAAAREKPSYGASYPDYDAHEPPRRHRSSRVPDEKSAKPAPFDDYGYAAPPAPRGRDRPLPTRDYDDPYERTPRTRQRQSVPPQTRSRYPEYDNDNDNGYGAPPPRRAASVNHRGRHGPDDEGPGGRQPYAEDRARPRARTAAADGGAGGAGGVSAGGASPAQQADRHSKQKKWGKQAGKMFMTHAVPVIKQEAVPFLTKAAQAYMQQKAGH